MNRSFDNSCQHSFDDLDDDPNSVIIDRIVTLLDFGLSDEAPVTNTGGNSDTELEFVNYFSVPGQNKSVIEKAAYPRLAQVTLHSIVTPKPYRRITTNSNSTQKRLATIESPRIRKSLIKKVTYGRLQSQLTLESEINFPLKLLLIVHFTANCDFQQLTIKKKIKKGAISRCSHVVKNLPLVGEKYAKIWIFPDRHFPIYRQNL